MVKKQRILIILFFTIYALIISGCTETAKSFDSQVANNEFANYLAGGNMAYFNNTLYLVYNSGNHVNIGTYKITNNGAENILDTSDIDYIFQSPNLYQYNNQLYSTRSSDGSILKYDKENQLFTNSELDIKNNSDTVYINDDLLVWNSDSDGTLNVRYKNNECILNLQSKTFYVVDKTVYFIDSKSWLYSYNVEKGDGKGEFITELNNDNLEYIGYCDSYFYYSNFGNNLADYKTGLYCYSFDENKTELILDKEICGLNSYNNILYIATTDGIYTANGKNCTKFSDIKTKEIYILDTQWIYTNDNNGNILRISVDGKTTEKIDFLYHR